MHQVIYNIIVITDLDKKVSDYIDLQGENLAYIAWNIRASYHCTVGSTPGQSVFDRYMIFKLASVIDWKFVASKKQ